MVFDRFADQLSGLLSKPVRYLSLFLITFYSASAFAIYTVAPTSLDFATVPVGNSSGIRIVTFTNNNTSGSISFTSISASGSYSITNNCPMQIDDLSLSSGTSCTVEVVFSPQTAGIHNAQLTYVGTDEGVDFTETVALTGVAEVVTFGELSLSPASLDFGSVAVGSSSSPLPVTLTNSGNAAVDITSITTTSPFAHSNDCPPTLTASGSCTIMVTATPATDGAISGSLTATGTGPQGTIRDETTLSANGSTPDVVVSDTQLSFPDGSVDTPSQPQVVTVSNQGTAAVTVNAITTEGDFSQSNNCGSQIAAGGSCDIEVVFTPQTTGSASGALNIDTSDGLTRILLSGSAAAPGNPVADLLRPYAGDNPNLLSLVDVIAEACPSGRLSDRLQEDCNAVVGAASGGDGNTAVALQQVLPESATKANATSRQGGETQIGNLGRRIAALRNGARGLSFNGLDLRIDDQTLPIELIAEAYRETVRRGGGASADNQLLASRLGVFVTGDITTGERDETDLESGLDFDTVGITIGADYRITNQFILGGAVGFVDTEAELENDAGDLDTQGVSLSLFGTYYSPQNYFVDFSATVGSNDFEQKRRIVYTLDGLADVSQQLKADYDGDMVSLFVGSGYDFNRGPWSFGPRADLEYIKSDVDGFTEEISDPTADGGGWATRVGETDQRWLTLNLGGKVSYTHSADWGVLIPYARLDWLHEFEDDSQVITAHFIEDPAGMGIEIQTDDPDRDYLRLRFGTSAQFQNGVVGFIDYGTILAHSEWSSHTISAGLRMEF
ncbi:MAG: autotransporter domain-containing protein [Candidatus Thiodiazotropha sp. (ex Lucina pensylvanica)]|nr:autotransporter domain-containing protein [Candidatus Thiodiazotropha sp. (ex Lucina pensylvanica)]